MLGPKALPRCLCIALLWDLPETSTTQWGSPAAGTDLPWGSHTLPTKEGSFVLETKAQGRRVHPKERAPRPRTGDCPSAHCYQPQGGADKGE